MKQEHYPSLELCKKLSTNSFPKTTEKVIVYKQLQESYGSHIEDRNGQHTNGSESRIVCPSVMELLDEIPQTIMVEGKNYTFNMDCSHGCWYFIWDDDLNYILLKEFDGGIPNALAEMILWLHENKYLTF